MKLTGFPKILAMVVPLLLSTAPLFADEAPANTAAAPAAAAPASGNASANTTQQGLPAFIPLILIFGIFYFLIIRPQQKRAKMTAQFQSDLKRGDMVVTNAGIIGVVKAVSEKMVTLEIDEGVCLKVLRNAISENANALKTETKPA